jgi:proton glutamate symport protein
LKALEEENRGEPAGQRCRASEGARGLSRTAWTLAAVAAGVLLGLLLHGSASGVPAALARFFAPVGQVWIAALQATVVPLVITQTLVAIAGVHGESVGALGARAILLFVLMLVAAGLFALAIGPALVALYSVDPASVAALRSSTSLGALSPEVAGGKDLSFGSWLLALVPRNVVLAASSGEILPILLFTAFFALAVSRLPPERREPLTRIFRALADATMLLVGWILRAAPIAVFALSFEMAIRAGGHVAGFMAAFIAMVSGAMLLFTVLLYPVTAVLGRTSLRRFARAVAPAQLIAASTRSSLASLPALVAGARQHLNLPASATGFVLPLSVSAFKVNRTISATIKLLFLAHVFRVPLGAGQLATFVATVVLMSFSSVGVPGGGAAFRTLPAYLAAGVPLEGVVILETVDTIPDIFKTITNVTGDMSAAILLSRSSRTSARA